MHLILKQMKTVANLYSISSLSQLCFEARNDLFQHIIHTEVARHYRYLNQYCAANSHIEETVTHENESDRASLIAKICARARSCLA